MARSKFLLIFLVIAQLILLMQQNANAVRRLDTLTLVSSPAPSENGMSRGKGDQAQAVTHIRTHHSFNKSMAGGDLILGGFATALIASIFCYIRVTRRRNQHSRG
ncbi:hypothetical protein K7X08_033389 [Anisodus acutangulus]|uniref:Transmembrane protein n=1 Tax=Anisodus acutangulus TaxID=402998 RepID=A0A9Q1M1I9_9SOLA|nr:hypothetical protein K7X08_033389 [Anisodus acutangulus]